jgi:hypothetical protein
MRRHESNLPFGGPAFPFVFDDTKQHHIFTGMTLRDYFAAKAMQAHMVGRGEFADSNKQTIAECAYKMADAMLEARES